MASEDDEWIGREAPFPREMQGRWVEESDPTLEVTIDGNKITWRGEERDYRDKKLTTHEDGLTSVTVEFADQPDYGDPTELIVLPNGAMYAYNVNFVSLFIRSDA